MIFLNLCDHCQKKSSTIKKGLVVKPILSSELNSRCQVDLIDMQAQPDGDYKFIMVYQDHLTKKWSEGLKFVQFMKNRSFHHGTKRSPYEAMFGTHAKVGLKSTQIPIDLISTLKSEEDLEKALGCGINIENINEKHEKSDGSDKDSAK
ncbi:KRAB-A domain-containing protein 2-like [Acyrthosiphon pisum]|uniref:Uncharacterized protein n=1 Tax=Acyrthosiphon pisum TaxID=7029 RepID=A0A8R2FBA5_ACYPI|nr:KRAB-A domain-containing protein 2-like [Acyrthosiphon pisum]|eukprot:XP_008186921.1 PREDICTED: KRAB-A domain-containing protein 2-like [Acyrthosiphon pisum]